MVEIRPFTFDEHDSREEKFEELINKGIELVVNRVAASLGEVVTADASTDAASLSDLGVIRTHWTEYVDDVLMAFISETWEAGAVSVALGLEDALPESLMNQINPLSVSSPAAQEYLQNASNRMVGISDVVWSNARDQLVEGQAEGESIGKLRDRLRASADLSKPRANATARTEVVSAANAGSYNQALDAGATGTKIWLARIDDRTRDSHRAADDQQVAMEEPFRVGGEDLLFPGDPRGSAGEVINCRCTITYDIDFSDKVVDDLIKKTNNDNADVRAPITDASMYDQRAALAKQDDAAAHAMTVNNDADLHKLTRNSDGSYRTINGVDGKHIEESVRAYQGTEFQSINGSLRTNKGNLSAIDRASDVSNTRGLDAAMDASTLDDDVILYRGLRNMADSFGLPWNVDPDSDFTGMTWFDHGFSSSTFSKTTVGHFGDRSGGAILNMFVPKGSKAIGIEGFLYENEILLNRGAKFEIIRDRGKEGKARVFDVVVTYD